MNIKILVSIATSCILVTSMFAYAKSDNLGGYYVVALDKDCEIILKEPMTTSQIDAYLQLHEIEKEIEVAHQPIDAIEVEIEGLSEQISAITERAITHQDGIITIDENLLGEQRLLTDDLEALIADHQPDFAKIERVAGRIEEKAERFEREISVILQGKDYDMVNIITPQNAFKDYQCRQAMKSM